jgi:hypothetical protein
MGIVTCGGCGLKFDRVAENGEFIKSKWYHQGCAAIKNEKIVLDNYICKLFNLKTPGPMNNILIKKYRDELGYNYDGMQKALKYFYEIKGHTKSKSEERVGIIPYVYQEAQDYYHVIESRARRIAGAAIETETPSIEVKVYTPQQTKKQTNDLQDLFNEE